jgi:hemoglobin
VSAAAPAKLYKAIGGAAGCYALAKAFYSQVERDPVLRPLFPSTFKCAIEAFAAFLVQFLGGETDAAQERWYLSLRESHARFSIGIRERDAWLGAMTATLSDESLIAESGARTELLAFFTHSSTHMVNQSSVPAAPKPLSGEAATLWDEQLALDDAIALARSPENAARCIEILHGEQLQARFARSPAVHACILALAAKSKSPLLRNYAVAEIGAHPALIFERYRHHRTVLHDACASGDVNLVRNFSTWAPTT